MRCFSHLTILLLALLLGCKKSRQTDVDRDDTQPKPPGVGGMPILPNPVRPDITTWPSNPALASQLDPAVAVMGYQIRPPKGYTFVTQGEDSLDGPETSWLVDPVLGNRVRRRFAVMIYPFPSNFPMCSLQDHVTIASARPKLHFSDVVQQPVEWGKIHGLDFGRVRWTGKDFFKKIGTGGSVYAAIDGQTLLRLLIEDEAPNGMPHSIAMAEEAFLTFRRAEAGTSPLDLKKASGGRIAPGRADDLPQGDTNGTPYRDTAPNGALLVGFDVGYVQRISSVDGVGTLRPLYRLGDKESAGQMHGPEIKRGVRVLAKPGYAIGSIKANTGLWIDGFSVTFMKLKGNRLDTSDTYQSEWMGGTGGNRRDLGGDGTPVIGISGHVDGEKRVTSIGLVYQKPGGGEGR